MGLIAEHTIAEILDRNDIVDVIAEHLSLKKMGRNFKACCPFHHEKTPSFVVNRDKQIFHCFGCGVGGNVISFVMQYDRVDFPTAAKILAQRVGLVVETSQSDRSSPGQSLKETLYQINEMAAAFFHEILLSNEVQSQPAQQYFKDRGVKLDTVKKLKLGFALESWDHLINHLRSKNMSLSTMEKSGLIIAKDKSEGFYDRFRGRVIFPIFDVRSRCIGFGARALSAREGAKYINSPETAIYAKREHCYGLHLSKQAIAQKDCVVVVEGYMDFLTPFQSGFENIVASLGTSLTTEQVRLLRRYTKNVVMLFDSDKAGQSAIVRNLDLLIDEEMDVKVAVLDQGDDPDSFVRQHGVEAFCQRIDQAKPLFNYKLSFLYDKYDRSTIEGKAKISSEMLPTIAKVRHYIAQEGYLRQLSQELSVSETALSLEMNKINTTPRETPVVVQESRPPVSARPVERQLLRLLLEEERMIQEAHREIDVSEFQDHHVRPVVEQIFGLVGQTQQMNVSQLVHYFKDQEIVAFLSELMAAPFPLEGDKDLLRKDYIQRIKNDRVRAERKQLCLEIQQAEAQGQEEMLTELKKRFNQLIKRDQ